MRKYFLVSFVVFTLSSNLVAAFAEEGTKDQGKSDAKETRADIKQGSKELWRESTKGSTEAAKEDKKESNPDWKMINVINDVLNILKRWFI